jgi:hypothetical protein
VKIFAILILLFSSLSLRSQTAEQGLDIGLHSVFIKCYIHHWKGYETSNMKGFTNDIKMNCNGFWDVFVSQSKNPDKADSMSSPFEIMLSGGQSVQISFSTWNAYLSDILAISTDNPLRKSK